MPVINPTRDPLNLGRVKADENVQAVQVGQLTSDVSPDVTIKEAGAKATGQALANFVGETAGTYVQKLYKQTETKAKGDFLKGSVDVANANSVWTGDVYRAAVGQQAMGMATANYISNRGSKLQQRLADGMSYNDAMAADHQEMQKLLEDTSKYTSLVGPEFTASVQNQLGQVAVQQNKEAAAYAAGQSVARADKGVSDFVASSAETAAHALNQNDAGGFAAQRDAVFSSIDNANFLSPEQKIQKKQAFYAQMAISADSSASINSMMQEANKSLGLDAAPVLNRLESQRQQATLSDRISLMNDLHADHSNLRPEDQLQLAQQNNLRIQQGIKDGTYSPEVGWSMMQAQAAQVSKAQNAALLSSYLTNGGDLSKVAAAQGKSAETVYNTAMEGASTSSKIMFAQNAQIHRDSVGFSLAMKDVGKSVGNELLLMQSTPGGELSDAQVQTLATLDAMKQQNPQMFDTLLDGMGDSGAMLRSLSSAGTINSAALSSYQAKQRQAQALAGKDVGSKGRNELIEGANSEVNSRFAVNGSYGAGALNRSSWNNAALSEVSKDVLAGLSNEQIALGGKDLIAQRMADRTMQVLLDAGGVRGQQVGSVISEPGVSLASTVGALGLANKEDLGNLIATRYKNLTDQYGSDADVVQPKMMRDGSLQFMVLNKSSGESYPVTFSAQQMHQQADEFMKARATGDDEYVKNEASVRPVTLSDGSTVLMRGTDFSIGSTNVKGNWVAAAGQELANQEGFSNEVYTDTKGNATYGIGMTKASGVQPHQVQQPQQAADKLQSLIQTNYGKAAVEAMNKQNLPVDKSSFVLMTELAYQSPASAQQMSVALGKYYRGEIGTQDVYSALRSTSAYDAGADRRKAMRENRLQHVLESLDQARRANRTVATQAG